MRGISIRTTLLITLIYVLAMPTQASAHTAPHDMTRHGGEAGPTSDRSGAPTRDAEIVTLEIVDTESNELDAAAERVLAMGGTVNETSAGMITVELPAERAAALGAEFDAVAVRQPEAVDIRPEGIASPFVDHSPMFESIDSGAVSRIGADLWHQLGHDGTGVTIGVIDYFDVALYWNDAVLGARPTTANARCFSIGADCTQTFFDGIDRGGERHGVAVIEVVRGVAPGARIVIGQARSLQDYRDLIDWFHDEGVTIISRSLGSKYDGPGDGRGGLDEIADYAVERGMLWVNSGGNNGDRKYLRQAVSVDNGWVSFGGSRFLEFEGTASIAGVRWANDWDTTPADRTDYDVYVYRAPLGHPELGDLIGSSTFDQRAGAPPLESFSSRFVPAAGERIYMAIKWVGGDVHGDVLEVLDYGDGIVGATQAEGSGATPIVDSATLGVVSVGAIDPPDSGLAAVYSAQGPTTDGRIVPTLTAPSGYPSAVWGSFSGTSAAAPVVAAAAAVMASGGLGGTPAEVAALLRTSVVDRGAAGDDVLYGAGELRLPTPPEYTSPLDAPASRFVSLAPSRLLDTRPASAVGPSELVGAFAAEEVRHLSILGVQGIGTSGVTAVVVNAVSVEADRPGFLQILPTGRAAPGTYSNLNTDAPGQIRANFAIVPVGDDGMISIYDSAAGHVIVDLLGYFEAVDGSIGEGRFVSIEPQRGLDTRQSESGQGKMTDRSSRTIGLPHGVTSSEVGALVVTVTATEVTADGWVQAYPTDDPGVIGATSTVNVQAGSTVANTAIVPAGPHGISVASGFAAGGSAHVIVDVIGYITSERAPVSEAGRFVPVRPSRAFDSRDRSGGLTAVDSVIVAASAAPGVEVPPSASAVVWNLAIVAARRPGFAQVWVVGDPVPSTSSLNWASADETRASIAIAGVNAGSSQFRVDDGLAEVAGSVGDLVVDVFGYFT